MLHGMWDLSSLSRDIEPTPAALAVKSLNHCTNHQGSPDTNEDGSQALQLQLAGTCRGRGS